MQLKHFFLFVLTLLGTAVNAQLGIQVNQTSTINFDTPISNVNQAFSGAGLATSPNSGQLDADAWSITGFSDGSQVFGQTATSGDFARGTSTGGVTTGGLYAFEVSSGNKALGIQPGGSDWTPGSITLKVVNTSNGTINDIDLSYLVYVRNDQNRSSSFNFSYSTDGNTFQSVSSLNLTSSANAASNPAWQQTTKSISLNNLGLAPNADFYLRWTGGDAGGSGSRDEFAIDNISLTASGQAASNCTEPNSQGSNLTFGTTTSNAIEINFNPAGDNSLVLYSTAANLTALPQDGVYYSAGNILGNATVLDYGNAGTYTASGLSESTTYYFFVFSAADNCTGAPNYLNSNPLTGAKSTTSDPNANYYANIGNQCGGDLKTALYNLINAHTMVSYSSLWTHYQQTDDHLNDTGNEMIVWDMYSDNPTGSENEFTFVAEQCGSYSGEGSCYNREHSFPKSWWGGSSSVPMYTDLFTVVPVDGWINGIRNNNPYGEVLSGTEAHITNNGSRLGESAISIPNYTGSVFEPIDAYKGDLARGYFYMATCYENLISNWETTTVEANAVLDGTAFPAFETWMIDMLLAWHTADPVSSKEIERNETIYAIQGNRNPFIDHPEYANFIWGSCDSGGGGGGSSQPDTEAPSTPLNLAGSNVTENSVELTWSLASDNVGVVSYNVYQNGVLLTSTTTTNLSVTSLTAATNYLFKVSAVDAAGNESALSPNLGITTAAISGPVVLHEGYFESGWDGWIDGGSDCARYTGSYASEGNYAIRIRDNSGTASSMTSPSFDLTAQSEVEIQFSFYVRSMESNEDFWLQYFNGSNWTTVATYVRGGNISNNQFYTKTVTLNSADYNFATNSQFRFRCDASGNNDQIFIDAVIISGSGGSQRVEAETGVTQAPEMATEKPIIEKLLEQNTIHVYPNPSQDWINIRSEENVLQLVLVYNINGTLLQEIPINQKEFQLNLQTLDSGIYILHLLDKENNRTYKRIIRQ